MNLKEKVKAFLKLEEGMHPDWVLDIIQGPDYEAFKEEIKRQSSKKRYLYLVTFTVDPKKYSGEEQEDEIENYILKQGNRPALRLIQFQLVKERCKSGMPHWHAFIESEKCLKKDRFNYYISKYGKIDISKSKTNDEDEIINYIYKTGAEVTRLDPKPRHKKGPNGS